MTLDIIVPHYKEPWEVGKPLFDSIALQRMVDFDDITVILVNDGYDDTFLSDKFDYPYKIIQTCIPHGGVSRARNAGLEISDADWVMFCDFDDCFAEIFAMHRIMKAVGDHEYDADVVISSFMEEAMEADSRLRLVPHDEDRVFLHGKAFRREYLQSNRIRFNPLLTLHEDVYFVTLATTICLPERIREIKIPLYLWRWNDNSIVRKDREHDFILETYDHLIRERFAIVEEYLRRGREEEADFAVIKTVIDTYYDSQNMTWFQPENADAVKKAENWFAAFLKRYAKRYTQADMHVVAWLAKHARENALKSGGFLMEKYTVDQWLRHIMAVSEPVPEKEIDVLQKEGMEHE